MHYARLLTDLLGEFGSANRAEINEMLVPKLSEALTAGAEDPQKQLLVDGVAESWADPQYRERSSAPMDVCREKKCSLQTKTGRKRLVD